jgi:extradiol dioxygenase family protein
MERAELVHLGIYCRDVEVLRKFYSEVFGLVVTDEGDTRIGYLVFLHRTRRSIISLCWSLDARPTRRAPSTRYHSA